MGLVFFVVFYYNFFSFLFISSPFSVLSCHLVFFFLLHQFSYILRFHIISVLVLPPLSNPLFHTVPTSPFVAFSSRFITFVTLIIFSPFPLLACLRIYLPLGFIFLLRFTMTPKRASQLPSSLMHGAPHSRGCLLLTGGESVPRVLLYSRWVTGAFLLFTLHQMSLFSRNTWTQSWYVSRA